jgi:hypothetical protein
MEKGCKSKQMEAYLSERNAQIEAIFSRMSDAILIMDKNA